MHGSTILYRLLETYPARNLLIAEGIATSEASQRIPNVQYIQYRPIWVRAVLTRFHRYTAPIATLLASKGGRGVPKAAADFQPDAVLTVVDGYTWQAAAVFAERARLPIHLIVHDDWPNVGEYFHGGPTKDFFGFESRWKDIQLRRWYATAASRLCISPQMADEYYRRYSATGDVLYPSRGRDAPTFRDPPDALKGPCEPFVVAFAGTIHSEYARALQRMAIALQKTSGRLIVYGQSINGNMSSLLKKLNIELRWAVSSSALINECRQNAHAVFIPMSHRKQDRANVELSFPSKLADMTATGLPLIIDGPDYSSIVRWANKNPGVAELVTDESIDTLIASIKRLKTVEHRTRLAREALCRGQFYFNSARATTLLHRKLRAGFIRPKVN
jgi:hypothetical protein